MKTPTFTPEQYAELAKKYGITPGPWRKCGGATPAYTSIHSESGYVVYGMADCFQHTEAGRPIKAPTSDTQRSNAKAIADLPTTLLHRDQLLAENERLKDAAKALHDVIVDSSDHIDYGGEFDTKISAALHDVSAALTGTTPSRVGELEKACRRAIMALKANGAPNCEAVKECKAALAGGAHANG